jgi:thioredoxin-related protein
MKHLVTFAILFCISQSIYSQADSIQQPPFRRFPTFPPVKLLLPDSTYFTKEDLGKKSAIMLMLFSPQCEHCQHETEELVKRIEQFKKVQIIMATTMHFDSMMAFREKYGLARFRNITITHDHQFFLPVFFNIRNLPFFAFYNRKKELISVFEGAISLDKALEIINSD